MDTDRHRRVPGRGRGAGPPHRARALRGHGQGLPHRADPRRPPAARPAAAAPRGRARRGPVLRRRGARGVRGLARTCASCRAPWRPAELHVRHRDRRRGDARAAGGPARPRDRGGGQQGDGARRDARAAQPHLPLPRRGTVRRSWSGSASRAAPRLERAGFAPKGEGRIECRGAALGAAGEAGPRRARAARGRARHRGLGAAAGRRRAARGRRRARRCSGRRGGSTRAGTWSS